MSTPFEPGVPVGSPEPVFVGAAAAVGAGPGPGFTPPLIFKVPDTIDELLGLNSQGAYAEVPENGPTMKELQAARGDGLEPAAA